VAQQSFATNSIRCVCFDWGGVILRHCRSWEEACNYVGLPVRAGAIDPKLVSMRREINAAYTTGKITSDQYFSQMTQANQGLYTEAELRIIHAGWLKREYAGLDRIILRLNRTSAIETALLSNTCASHWSRHLPSERGPADYPTISLIRHKHASHLLGHSKPGQEIYRAFEAATGFQGACVLFFDDLPENIKTAEQLGWQGELIDHTQETAPQVIAALTRHGLWHDAPAQTHPSVHA
jgi:FMN phosphatase YigB (HAD superfamily)